MISTPIDMSADSVNAIISAIMTQPVGTWITYYEGSSPTAEQTFGARHAQVAATIRRFIDRGLVTAALQRIEAGTLTAKGRYRYMVKVTARPKA